MGGERAVRVAAGDPWPPLLEWVGGQKFPLDGIARDPKARTATIPFERKYPRPESWELVVRGVRTCTLLDRKEQATDYFKTFRHDEKTGVLEIEAVLVRLRLEVDSLDVEARCLTKEEKTGWDVADLPKPILREVDAEGTLRVRAEERYAKAEKERLVGMTAAGAIAGLLFGVLIPGNPWFLWGLHLALGLWSGRTIATKRWEWPPSGALGFGLPQAVLGALGTLMGGESGHVVVRFALLGIAVVAPLIGMGLVALNAAMMDWTSSVTAGKNVVEAERLERTPLPPGLPRKAALITGGTAAAYFFVFDAPAQTALLAAPLATGAIAWFLAWRRVEALNCGITMGVLGFVLAGSGLSGGRMLFPAAAMIAVAYPVAGMMIAYHARGEGPGARGDVRK